MTKDERCKKTNMWKGINSIKTTVLIILILWFVFSIFSALHYSASKNKTGDEVWNETKHEQTALLLIPGFLIYAVVASVLTNKKTKFEKYCEYLDNNYEYLGPSDSINKEIEFVFRPELQIDNIKQKLIDAVKIDNFSNAGSDYLTDKFNRLVNTFELYKNFKLNKVRDTLNKIQFRYHKAFLEDDISYDDPVKLNYNDNYITIGNYNLFPCDFLFSLPFKFDEGKMLVTYNTLCEVLLEDADYEYKIHERNNIFMSSIDFDIMKLVVLYRGHIVGYLSKKDGIELIEEMTEKHRKMCAEEMV